eukprot:g18227.t1
MRFDTEASSFLFVFELWLGPGVADTLDAKVEPNAYSITDGSYAVFRRSLFMNVDNSAWERAHAYLAYGFTDAGQQAVANVGYVAVNANLRNKMEQRIAEKGNAQADYVPVPPSMCWNGTELFEDAYTNEFGNPKAGSVTSEAGQPACEFCLPGTYALQGSTNCSSCAKNSIAAAPGAGRCDACAAGYQTEASAQRRGALKPRPKDIAFYNRTNSSYSVNRPYPQLLPGFYSTREEPLSVYKCKEEDVCLGGDPESCEGGVSLMSLEGFRCKSNPNGKSILQAFGAMVCWEGGEHNTLVILSVFAILLFPVMHLTLTGYASLCFGPLSVKYGLKFTNAVRFLTGRMQPEAWQHMQLDWSQVRNFLVSLAPVLASSNYGAQVTLILAVFVLCIIAIFTATLWLLIALAGYKVVNHLRKRSAYDVFLTHHKAAAALSARHLKTLFNMCTTLNVFLDVDELDNLDNLSFAVKHTRKLLVMLTSDVLRRPWCAVEIGTAYLNKVPLGVVQINADNVDLSDDFITDVVENFTAADKGIFAKAGITVQDGQPGTQELLGFMKKPKVVPLDSEKVVYIVFNTRDDFQCSVAFQLRHLFRQQGWNSILFCGSSGHRDSSRFHQRSRSRIYDGPEELQGNFSELLPIKQKAVAVVLMSKGLPWDPIAAIAPGCHTEELASALSLGDKGHVRPRVNALGVVVADVATSALTERSYSLCYPEQNQNLLRQEFSIVQERALKEYSRRAIKVEEQGTYASGCYPPGSSVEVPSVSEKSEKSEKSERVPLHRGVLLGTWAQRGTGPVPIKAVARPILRPVRPILRPQTVFSRPTGAAGGAGGARPVSAQGSAGKAAILPQKVKAEPNEPEKVAEPSVQPKGKEGSQTGQTDQTGLKESQDVFLYYWDERDGDEQKGWWFGNELGGLEVWACHLSDAQEPPRRGWKVPWDNPNPNAPELIGVEPAEGESATEPTEPATEPPAAEASAREEVAGLEEKMRPVWARCTEALKDGGNLEELQQVLAKHQQSIIELGQRLQDQISEARKNAPKDVPALVKLQPTLRAIQARLATEQRKAKTQLDKPKAMQVKVEPESSKEAEAKTAPKTVPPKTVPPKVTEKPVITQQFVKVPKPAETEPTQTAESSLETEQELESANKKLTPLRNFRAQFKEKAEAKQSTQNLENSLAEIELEVEKASMVLTLSSQVQLHEEEVQIAERSLKEASQSLAKWKSQLFQRLPNSRGAAADELRQLSKKGQEHQGKIDQLFQQIRAQRAGLQARRTVKEANEKVAQAEETLIKCSEAEDGQRALRRGGGTVGRRNRGSKEDPDESGPALAACDAAVKAASMAHAAASLFLKRKIAEVKKMAIESSPAEEMEKLRERAEDCLKKIEAFRKDTEERRANDNLAESGTWWQGLDAKLEDLKEALEEAPKEQKVLSQAMAEASKLLVTSEAPMAQKQDMKSRLATINQGAAKHRSAMAHASRLLKGKEQLEDQQQRTAQLEAQLMHLQEMSDSIYA